MDERTLTLEQIMAYGGYLRTEERAPGTIEKYLRDARSFAVWLDGAPVTKENATGWKEQLRAQGYAPATINSMLAALNNLFRFLGWNECHMKFLKIQRKLFRDTARQLIRTAEAQGKHRLALLMETICATGVRVSEVKYLTVEAARTGCAEISLKGKIRTILLPNKLCRKLLKYAKKQKIASGEIFLTKSGKGLSRRQIWAEMKRLCAAAGVEPSKVFPHNLRHLFARTFYGLEKNLAKLADLLGHSSIETTRIYLVTSGAEHQRTLDRLGLIS